jgi:LPXTG-site transpeptidase (sortase) family protein
MSVDAKNLSGVSERSQIEQSGRTSQTSVVIHQRLGSKPVHSNERSVRPRRDLRAEASRRLTKWFRLVLLAALGAALIVAADSLLGTLMHRSRQGQLAADFITPRNFQATDRAIAVLQIPSLGLNQTVAQGIGPATLRGGPGHAPESAIPGAAGNAVIFGHRSRFGGPFSDIDTLSAGDLIFVQPKGTSEIVGYVVTKVTSGGDELLPALAPSDETRLSLVTSSGGLSSTNRTVVEAVADAPASRLPTRSIDPTAVTSFEVPTMPLNGWHLGAFVWLGLAVAVRSATRRMYASRTRLLLISPAVALGLLWLWLAVDSWLTSTL